MSLILILIFFLKITFILLERESKQEQGGEGELDSPLSREL